MNFSKNQLQRYPLYLKLFRSLYDDGHTVVSSPSIAKALGYSQEQVRKDLQAISDEPGRPKKGRDLKKLIDDLEVFLGYREPVKAVLIGAGHLGSALLNYPNFVSMGLEIAAAFDKDPSKVGSVIGNLRIRDIEELQNSFVETGALIAVISVPASFAQEVANEAIRCGAKGIWNFAPTHLDVPPGVVIENVNLASSLAVLGHRLSVVKSK